MSEIDGDESSDLLIDLQIEESLGRETLMSIDSSNHMDDTVTIVVYLLLLLLNIAVAYFGPNTVETFRKVQKLTPGSEPGTLKVSFAIESITTLNQYLMLRISPVFSGKPPLKVDIKSQTDLQSDGTDVGFVSYALPSASFERSNDTKAMLSVFSTRVSDYSSYVTHLTFAGPDVKRIEACLGEWVFGDLGFVVVACIYRILFACVITVACFMLHCKLRGTAFSMWHFEQKLCIGLMYSAILMNNPFCPLLIWTASAWMVLVDTVFHSVFVAYVKFFVISLFDSLRFKNRRISECFFLPKLVFFGLFLLSQGQYEYAKGLELETVAFGTRSWTAAALLVIHWVLELAFMGWFIFVCIRAHKEIDVTEKFKFSVYISVSVLTLVILWGLDVLGQGVGFFNISCYGFVLRISTENLFVVLMLTFHWPYELISDQYLVHNDTREVGDFYGSD